MKMNLSIMEFGLTDPPNLMSHQVLNSIFSEIALYEELGYQRFWLSEHFSPEFAWFSPEMLLPLLAGYSNNIKIGWCGVLLNYHNPLLVASNLRQLSALFDDRIDLGIAGARIAGHYDKVLPRQKAQWADQVKDLCEMAKGSTMLSPDRQLIIPPQGTINPDLWYLATGPNQIQTAVDNKMNFALSLMHPNSNLTANVDTLKRYKEAWYKTHGTEPVTMLLLGTLGTENTSEKEALEKQFQIPGFNGLFGCFDYINEELYRLQDQLSNDEFCLYNPIADRERRIYSYEEIIKSLN